jgi:hypothetical protein
MTKLTNEYLRPVFKTSRQKLKDFFEQNDQWSKYLGKEIDFTTFEVLRSEFLDWKKANDKKSGRKIGTKDSYKRTVIPGFKRPRAKED